MSVIVIEFSTLDGVVEDPDGRGGTPGGGWAFRYGPAAVAGDKFHLGPLLDDGVMLLGRRTWELFAGLWPNRDDPFSQRMNAVPKLVATHSGPDVSAWTNSTLLDGDLADAVKREHRDVVVAGSLGIVHTLMRQDLIDEYRLLTFPCVLGQGRRLFPEGAVPAALRTVSAELTGPAVLSRHQREN